MLSGKPAEDDAAIAAARRLRPAHLIVTSAPAPPERIATLSVAEQVLRCETACAPQAPHGMGDVCRALCRPAFERRSQSAGIACASLAQMANQTCRRPNYPWAGGAGAARLTDKLADKPVR